MALKTRDGTVVFISDIIEEEGIEFEAQVTNGVVDFVVANVEEGRSADVSELFREPYIVDRFKAFLTAVQEHEQ